MLRDAVPRLPGLLAQAAQRLAQGVQGPPPRRLVRRLQQPLQGGFNAVGHLGGRAVFDLLLGAPLRDAQGPQAPRPIWRGIKRHLPRRARGPAAEGAQLGLLGADLLQHDFEVEPEQLVLPAQGLHLGLRLALGPLRRLHRLGVRRTVGQAPRPQRHHDQHQSDRDFQLRQEHRS
jgi:hypothetical protein